MSDILFSCKNLSLSFNQKRIFANLNFQLKDPGVVEFKGTNGSGKTTLLKILAGFYTPHKGQITHRFQAYNKRENYFSFMPSTSLGLLPELTGSEHIHLISLQLRKKISNQENIFKKIENHPLFHEITEKKAQDYSNGMKQFLRLYLHLFFSPQLVFLDEPFNFLSPELQELWIEVIEKLSQHALIFYASPTAWPGKTPPIYSLTLGDQ